MLWWYIRHLLGPGLHWGKSKEELQQLIDQAEEEDMPEAAEHLRIILQLRNDVYDE